jgi:hypothetical protein
MRGTCAQQFKMPAARELRARSRVQARPRMSEKPATSSDAVSMRRLRRDGCSCPRRCHRLCVFTSLAHRGTNSAHLIRRMRRGYTTIESVARIRILKTPPAPIMDGIDVSGFERGRAYTVGAHVAHYLVVAGYATVEIMWNDIVHDRMRRRRKD